MSVLSKNPPFGSCDFSLDAQPPKKPHMLLDRVPDSQAKGSWSACVHGHGFWGQYPPATRSVDEYTRGLGRMSWVTAPRPCYGRELHVIPSINSLGRWYGTAKAPLFPPWLFFFNSIFLLYYLSTYRHPARSSFHHGATSSKCGSKNSLFSPSVIHDPLVLHTRKKMICHCSWRGWGNWLLWLQQNLFPGCFELIILEVLHPSQLSKHHLE